jgi:hypothetical protein
MGDAQLQQISSEQSLEGVVSSEVEDPEQQLSAIKKPARSKGQ